ncbi:TPA: 1-deoxy-D-xylulose-5-phosphate synthase [Listeria monocytogenes]|uniref:1-deoxy-D-xylulose-5-phosphate synthase n=2 Tax=Listeria monocytogenes TaxID=1639 RepID=UPI00098E6F20|nr:1-deoxy-D-xylulose-5-phosphate synthase [Listeria monocytogenes]EAF4524624.1 1-deoxy-D-xylulose-5-phosphate synthase [Listeria monocytogenes serotype 1/2a]EHC6201696.1 1-deoxy-D-xylulose-5-phosphate synthase [Listeria monocytogenes serotype 1/2c]EAA0403409.1 1-deoxy-D-xylulose-5-phosphate synthase [Listeria monocytogenes]EAC2546203.1 1-deoxy-D-xylulose-5-phosphate synthase [Listeria monocytogenes]EAC4364559.1 1-deoxy-D-xylulose-5-phosphate synthase [Listeria monocytogenes]
MSCFYLDLLKIKDPSFMKRLDIQELEALAADIRAFLITSTSKSGGHIGPNLGVVELTIALHYSFNSPKDKFIWDVGHQSYVHKILTGRANQFGTLREHGGLDGFPKRKESIHDVFETGHSSTSLSAAAGMVIARDIKKEDFYVIPIIGDGALTGGMALEALNHIGDMGKDMIVILNDNDMSIAPNVGAIHNILGKLRTSDTSKQTKTNVDGAFFEELGFMYLGSIDGHDIEEVITNLELAKRAKGPVLLHIVTKKGKGYQPAELDSRGTWHGTGPYKVETGSFIKPAKRAASWSSVISNELIRLAEMDERIVAITPAMPVGSKLEKFAKAFPERFFDVGIAEQHATTMAAGLATQGMKPFLAIYSTFLQRAYDQLVHDVCRQKLNVVIGIDRAGLVGADGETHQGIFDISFLNSIPNMTISMPKDEVEARQLMDTAFSYNDGPFAIRYPRGEATGVQVVESNTLIPIGQWETIIQPLDAVILTFGPTIELALKAAEQLEIEGYRVGVINARYIKPLDEALLHQILKQKIPILTVEESLLKGGFGANVLEFIEANNYRDVIMHRIGLPDEFISHGSVSIILESFGISTTGLVLKIKEMLAQSGKLRAKRL